MFQYLNQGGSLKMANKNRTPQQKLDNINYIRYGAALTGNLLGLGLAYRQGVGFWGYIGRMIIGGIALGGIATLATLPAAKKAKEEMDL